jgi:hypothetical protein
MKGYKRYKRYCEDRSWKTLLNYMPYCSDHNFIDPIYDGSMDTWLGRIHTGDFVQMN